MTAPSREELIGLLRDAEDCHALFGDAADALEADQKRIAELEAAVRWALGEGDSDFPGLPVWIGARFAPYGWRTHLRAMAFSSPPGGGG